MEFQNVVKAKVDEMFDSGKVDELVTASVSKAVTHAIEESLNSYGGFRSKLKELLDGSLKVDASTFNLMSYNHSVLAIVQKIVDGNLDELLNKQLKVSMESILETPPLSIKMSAVVEKFIEFLREDLYEGDTGEITCIIEKSSCSDGYWHFYLDKKADTSMYSCAIHGAVTKDGEVYSLTLGGANMKDRMFLGPKYGFERLIFQLHAAKTKLELDEDAITTSYGDY